MERQLINSFGVPESLIIGGTLMVTSGRSTEGFVALGLGLVLGFIRFTTWFGINKENKNP